MMNTELLKQDKVTVALGEIMLRLSPRGNLRFAQADELEVHYGGAEANVAVSLSLLGERTRFVTKLPAHDFGENALRFLQANGVDTSRILRGGERIGTYFFERGASQRGSRVIYDRKNSAFALSSVQEYDFDYIFEEADFLHVSGITPALGGDCARLTETAICEAKKRGMTVSFDPNYRARLWAEDDAKACFEKLLPHTDILITSSDGLSVLGIKPTGEDAEATLSAAETLFKRYNLRAVALTMRGHISANENRWTAVYYDGTGYVSNAYLLHIVDRVGGGDAFAAGLIYALKQGFDGQKTINFATAAGAIKHTIEGDVNFATKEEILALMNHPSGRVLR